MLGEDRGWQLVFIVWDGEGIYPIVKDTSHYIWVQLWKIDLHFLDHHHKSGSRFFLPPKFTSPKSFSRLSV